MGLLQADQQTNANSNNNTGTAATTTITTTANKFTGQSYRLSHTASAYKNKIITAMAATTRVIQQTKFTQWRHSTDL